VAETVAADSVYVAQFEKEGVRSIMAVSATRSRKALMAEVGGPAGARHPHMPPYRRREMPGGRSPMRSARPRRKSRDRRIALSDTNLGGEGE
jgi:hypothetical protein